MDKKMPQVCMKIFHIATDDPPTNSKDFSNPCEHSLSIVVSEATILIFA